MATRCTQQVCGPEWNVGGARRFTWIVGLLMEQPRKSRDPREMRRAFLIGLLAGLRVVWPVLSGILLVIVSLGLVIGVIEGWSVHESIYFAFVSGLTIGYGDFAPKTLVARVLAVLIGACGILVSALAAAIAVKALNSGTESEHGDRDG